MWRFLNQFLIILQACTGAWLIATSAAFLKALARNIRRQHGISHPYCAVLVQFGDDKKKTVKNLESFSFWLNRNVASLSIPSLSFAHSLWEMRGTRNRIPTHTCEFFNELLVWSSEKAMKIGSRMIWKGDEIWFSETLRRQRAISIKDWISVTIFLEIKPCRIT